ncbi:MAG: hypothetical protein M1820_007974 [Bogoriella megaspora]|nr:MAG: hypothetical protein M1820_007974 [Bogoriella megaspora]
MHLTLSPLTPSRFPSAFVIGASAFRTDSLRQLIYPAQLSHLGSPLLEQEFRFSIQLQRLSAADIARSYYLMVVDTDADAEEELNGVVEEEEREEWRTWLESAVRRIEGVERVREVGRLGGEVVGVGRTGEEEVVRRGRMVGLAIWVAPEGEGGVGEEPGEVLGMAAGVEEGKVGEGEPEEPVIMDGEVRRESVEKLRRERERVMGSRKDYWYLASLLTHEEYQRKGVAKLLLNWGIEQADRDGADIYLESSPAGLPVYKKFGFKPEGGFVMNNSDYALLSMLKQPSTRNEGS